MKKSLLVILGLALFTGCATQRKTGWEDQGIALTLSDSEKKTETAKAKDLWNKRVNRADLEAALQTYEKLVSADPKNLEQLTTLARGYYFLGDAHYDDMDTKKKYWEIAAKWGERAMATNSEFYKIVVTEKKNMEDALDTLTTKESPSLYWTAVSLGKWSKASGLTTVLKYKGLVKKMIEKVEALTPNYFYGAVPRYWGVFYAVAPGFAGGSIEKSEISFKKSFAMSNDYLATHVLYAENYATHKGDKELFKKELNWVIAANPKKIPEIEPEQTLEQAKAKKLLGQMDELF